MNTVRAFLAVAVVSFVAARPGYGELPSSFDWRTQGVMSPIVMSQACYDTTWALASTSVLESAAAIDTGSITRFSAQWLASCNLEGYTCQSGTWRHGLDYFMFKRDPCGQTGPVPESVLPFDGSGENDPCGCPYPHQKQYLIDAWRYVGDADSVPTVEAIKQAIYEHGPIVAGVYGSTSSYFQYSGGVYSSAFASVPDRAIVLVGWDDNQGTNGVWFLRESWGSLWGESGYMRIAYGSNNVGYAAAYVEFPGAHDLDVIPYNEPLGNNRVASFSTRGPAGGPFQSQCRTYTLTNLGASPIAWAVDGTQNWLDVAPSSGTLPASASAQVSVCLNTNADALPAGIHTDTLTFSNLTAGKVRQRHVVLAVDQVDHLTEFFQGQDNDLDNTMLTFVPDGSTGFYSLCVEPITEFPTDPGGGEYLPNVGHNKFNTVSLTDGRSVSLFGAGYSTFYVGTNGYITFAGPDNVYRESLDQHFRVPRVSALFEALYVTTQISFKQLADRAVATYTGVTEDAFPGTDNAFQIELFYDGRIRISYLNIDCRGGIVGLSRGQGVPGDFVESDITGYGGSCDLENFRLPDFDFDGDIDLVDFGQFQSCLGGPTVTPVGAPCYRADLDDDCDVDRADVQSFVRCLSGTGVAIEPTCLDP